MIKCYILVSFFVLYAMIGHTKSNVATLPNYKLIQVEFAKNNRETISKDIELDDFRGKVIYLDFWATWCLPCLKSMPILNELRHKYQKQGFEVLAINVDKNDEQLYDFLQKINVNYPILKDKENKLSDMLNVSVYPTAFIVAKNGNIETIHKGFKTSDRFFLEAVIEKLLAESLN